MVFLTNPCLLNSTFSSFSALLLCFYKVHSAGASWKWTHGRQIFFETWFFWKYLCSHFIYDDHLAWSEFEFFFSFFSSEFLASLQLPRLLLRYLKPFLLLVLSMWLSSTSPITPVASRIFSILVSWNFTMVCPWVGLLFIPFLNPQWTLLIWKYFLMVENFPVWFFW